MQTKELTKESRKLPTIFNDFFKPWDEWFDNGIWFKTMNTPSVNIVEESDQYIVTLAVPGLKKNDFDIVVDDNNMLIISCEKEEEKEKEDKNFTRREYNYSSFSRSLSLPEEIKRDRIDATYEDGILKIRLPRNPEAKIHSQKRINVN
jgi:HSP20 family protein